MQNKKKNFREDFKLLVDLGENYQGERFTLIFHTGNNTAQRFVCKYDGTKYERCVKVDSRRVLCLFDNHGLGVGVLHLDVLREVIDAQMPDGVLRLADSFPVSVTENGRTYGVEITRGKSDNPLTSETTLLLLANIIKGDPLTYADLTAAQIAELKRPATEAAAEVREDYAKVREWADETAEDFRALSEQVGNVAGDAATAADNANTAATAAGTATTNANTAAAAANAAAARIPDVGTFATKTELAAKQDKLNYYEETTSDGGEAIVKATHVALRDQATGGNSVVVGTQGTDTGVEITTATGKKAKVNGKEIATADQIPDTSALATKAELNAKANQTDLTTIGLKVGNLESGLPAEETRAKAAEAAEEARAKAAEQALNGNLQGVAQQLDAQINDLAAGMQQTTAMLSQQVTAAEQKNNSQDVEIAKKLNKDGYSVEARVGLADDIVNQGDAVEVELTKKTCTGSSGLCHIERVKGNTIKYNQLVQNCDFSNGLNGYTSTTGKLTYDEDGVATITSSVKYSYVQKEISVKTSNKYLVYIQQSTDNINASVIDVRISNDKLLKCETINKYYELYAIDTPTSGTAKIFFFRNTTEENVTTKTKKVLFFDLTEMFGAGNEPETLAEFKANLGYDADAELPALPYNAGGLVNMTAHAIKCGESSASWLVPMRSYFSDGLKSAGDVYDEIGKTKAYKRIGSVDLGTLTWSYNSTQKRFTANDKRGIFKFPNTENDVANILLFGYVAINFTSIQKGVKDMSIAATKNNNGDFVAISNFSYTNAEDFSAAMSGVILYYELATPQEYDVLGASLDYRTTKGTTEEIQAGLFGNVSAPLIADIFRPFDAYSRITSAESIFRDIWNDACGEFGKYNEKTGFYELNGLTDITYEQAVTIYNYTFKKCNYPINSINFDLSYAFIKSGRTTIPTKTKANRNYYVNMCYNMFCSNDEIEIIKLLSDSTSVLNMPLNWVFESCNNLKEIKDRICINSSATSAFTLCRNLERVFIHGLKYNITIPHCGNLSAESVSYMINNASTNAITITLNAISYARAIADADVQAALAAHTNVTLTSA